MSRSTAFSPLTAGTDFGVELQRRPTAVAFGAEVQRRPTATAIASDFQRKPSAAEVVVPPGQVPLAKVYEEDEEEVGELFRSLPARQARVVYNSLLILVILLVSILGFAALLLYTFNKEVEHTTSLLAYRHPLGGATSLPSGDGLNATSAGLSGNRLQDAIEEYATIEADTGETNSQST